MNNQEFEKLYNNTKFKRSIEKYVYSRYRRAKHIFDSAAIDFEDVKEEIWLGISQAEADKPIAFYMHVAKCDIKDYIEYAAHEYCDSLEYNDETENDVDDFRLVLGKPAFVAVKVKYNDRGYVHLAESFNATRTVCGLAWRDDVAYDIPDGIDCPKCRKAYFDTVKLA